MRGHEHEFAPEPSSVIIEDGAWIIHHECEHVEVRGTSYSKKHDEVFYDEGPSCEASQSVRLDATSIEAVYMGGETETLYEGDALLISDDVPVKLQEQIDLTLRDAIDREVSGGVRPQDVGDDVDLVDASPRRRVVDVHTKSGTYRVTFGTCQRDTSNTDKCQTDKFNNVEVTFNAH